MLSTLRARLIASHVLPLIIIIPLMGLALVYMLETRVILPNLARQLTGQAVLVGELTREHPEIWQDPAGAGAFVSRISPLFPGQLMLLSSDGVVLASSDPAEAGLVGRSAGLAGVPEALAGRQYSEIRYSPGRRAEVADVLVPVPGASGAPAGVVRLTDYTANVWGRFSRLRYVIAEVLIAGLAVGAGLGLGLAVTIERPIQRVTNAVHDLAGGGQLAPLPETGPAETRLLARAFNTLAERLTRLEKARRQLLANLVHELGRPLGTLGAASHALLNGALYDDPILARELLAGISGQVERLDRLLDDLADLHDHVLGTLELDRKPLALGDWLPPELATWREAARQKGLDWQVTLAPALPTVSADGDRLGQAVGNLLSNAVKYTPAGGRVCVEAGADPGWAWLRVADSGPGIPLEEQDRIFDPFYRNPQGRRFPQGMGLGLTIARDVVAAHGGRLDLESRPDQGSCFTIRLPLAPPQ